jgi:hypothetical protein
VADPGGLLVMTSVPTPEIAPLATTIRFAPGGPAEITWNRWVVLVV